MKRFILVILAGVFLVILNCGLAAAGEEEATLTATASSIYYNLPQYYGADKAIDGDYRTYWLGGLHASPWWIVFDAGQEAFITKLAITWYSDYYKPTDYDIEVSTDNQTWEPVFTGLNGEYAFEGINKDINQKARYIRLYIREAGNFAVLREFAAYSTGALPRLIRFQGTLKDTDGTRLDGAYTVTFKLYDGVDKEQFLWEEDQTVTLEDGSMDVELGSVTALNLAFDMQYWLGVTIEGDDEMSPRFKLTSVPYALNQL